MAKIINPLAFNVPIVDPRTGYPTEYFKRILEDIADAKISASLVEALGGDPDEDQVVTWDDTLGDLAFKPASEVLDMIGSEAHGDILYRDSASWALLPAGTDGKVLTTHGAGADPTWETAAGGGAVTLISEQIATGSEHAITFNTIPNTYRSLRLEVFGRTDEAVVGSPFTTTCNNDTSAIYDAQRQYAQSATAGADQFLSTAGWTTTVSLPGSTATASHLGHVVFEFLNYKDTSFYKTMKFQGRQMNSTTTGNAFVMHGGGSYRSTSAISRIDLTIATAAKVFISGSTFRLYGIS